MTTVVVFRWSDDLHDGDGQVVHAMVPEPRFRKAADREYELQTRYRMEAVDEASMRSRRHYFAAIKNGWDNLPEDEERFPTTEHLRKWALIKTGYYEETSFACSTKAEAQRMRAFVSPMDEYAIVTVKDEVVRVFKAKSQSVKAMGGRKEFQESKWAVLDLIAEMIGTSREALTDG